MDKRMWRGVRYIENHHLTTPRPIQANGGGDLVPLLGNISRSSQCRPSKGDRDQPKPGLVLLESLGGTGDTLQKIEKLALVGHQETEEVFPCPFHYSANRPAA